MTRVVGIDVAGDAAWLVALDVDATPPCVVKTLLASPVDAESLRGFCADAAVVAVDAPGGRSALAHLGDDRLAPKFRRARCGEVAMHRAGISVPWTAPAPNETLAAWMATGLAIWEALASIEGSVIETYPHGVLWRLAGRPLLRKDRPAGHLARLAVLGEHLQLPDGAALWSHDGIDALAAALVAAHAARGVAQELSCADDEGWSTHDGSAIWLPAARPPDRERGPALRSRDPRA